MNIVFSNFRTHQLTPTIAQDHLSGYIAWIMAAGRCKDENITEESAAQKIYLECQENVSSYGVPSHLIGRRQYSLLGLEEDTTLTSLMNRGELPVFNTMEESSAAGSPLETRMSYFSEKMTEVFGAFYNDIQKPPDDIIHVTCSGYISPSPAQRLVSGKGWGATNVTHSYHMGCYGAFPAANMAMGFLASSHHVLSSAKHKVDIVHTELLSSHADFADHSPANIVIMTLFADGYAKYSAYSEAGYEAEKEQLAQTGLKLRGLKIKASHTVILPDSLEDMTWIPKSNVFEMFLSKNVPLLIRENVEDFMVELVAKAGISYHDEKSNIAFAIHPGGPKILNYIRDTLGIKEQQLRWSRDVLNSHGNMSSATVPYIWKSMLEDEAIATGTLVVSIAFGPGLTATGLLFEVI
jgi:alkylresorcinol/alkylpyrone synthase